LQVRTYLQIVENKPIIENSPIESLYLS
jgi:hypothetical protein